MTTLRVNVKANELLEMANDIVQIEIREISAMIWSGRDVE
jgi:hypothetical protein